MWGFTKMRAQLFTLKKGEQLILPIDPAYQLILPYIGPTNAWLLDNGSKHSPWVQHLLTYINTEKGPFWAQTGVSSP